MRMVGYALLYALLLALVVVFNASAHRARTPIHATVRCAHVAEDSMAHLRMVDYTPLPDGSVRVKYVCRRAGY